MDDFEKELKQGFLEEAAQLIGDTEQCFLQIESNPEDKAVLEKIFRLAHNLKGSAKAVGYSKMGEFTHSVESLLLKLKNGEVPVVPAVVGLLLRCNDHIKNMIEVLKTDLVTEIEDDALFSDLKHVLANGAPQVAEQQALPAEPVAPAPEAEPQIQEISVGTVDTTASAAFEEMEKHTEAKLEKATKASKPTGAAVDDSIRVSSSRLDRLLNFIGEMVILQTVLKEQASITESILLKKTVHQLGKVGKEVQDMAMGLRMVPVKQTFLKMQRIVRDTASLLGKKVNLILDGQETELDKTVLESISDPLVHMIRNAVDHGIEAPAERVAAGKPEQGTVQLMAYHHAGRLMIEIRDDGAGINHEKLLAKAISNGIFKPGTQMTKQQAVALIFHPGLSIKSQVTEVSGRGVGMDVVRTNIEALQGTVEIDTELGKGSTFKISLPLTLAIIDGMIVRNGSDRFVIPLSHVHESVQPKPADLRKTTGIGDVLLLRGENLPLFKLNSLLGGKAKEAKNSDQIAIVIRTQGEPFSILVDDIVGQQQVVIKKLGGEIKDAKGFSGSAILGDGKPALILELNDLIGRRRAA